MNDSLSDDELMAKLRDLDLILAPLLAKPIEGEVIDEVQSQAQ